MKTLREELPSEAMGCEYTGDRFRAFADVEVVKSYGAPGEPLKRWPGKHRNVVCWYELANGYAVGWNENPGRGWSFPVVALPEADRTPAKKSTAAAVNTGFAPATATRATRGRNSQGQTCSEAQAANADEAEGLLRELLERIPGMRNPTKGADWGHVGSSAEFVRLLRQAARFA